MRRVSDVAGAGGHRAKMVPASKRGTASLGKKRVRGACGHRHYHSTVFGQEPPWVLEIGLLGWTKSFEMQSTRNLEPRNFFKLHLIHKD